MNDLITSNPTMTSREIAELTSKQHAHVMRDIRSMLAQLRGGKPEDYAPEKILKTQENPILDHGVMIAGWGSNAAGQPLYEYRLDKDHTLTLLTGYDANSRMRVIKRWQELETHAIALPDFTDPVAAARAWADAKEAERTAKAGEAKALEHLEAAQPAIEFHERVGDADSLHSIDETAKALQAPPRKFRDALKTQLDLFRKDGLPRREYIDRGYVRIVETMIRLPQGDKPYPQTFFTGKGLQWIQRRLDHLLMGAEL